MYKIDFFNERYDPKIAKLVEPFYHGDYFEASYSENVVFGDYLTGVTYGFDSNNVIVVDLKPNFYGIYQNAEWAQYFAGDTLNTSNGKPVFDGQKGKDVVIGNVKNIKTDAFVTARLQRFFTEQTLAVQMQKDLYNAPLVEYEMKDAQRRFVCNANPHSYIPLHTFSNYSDTLSTPVAESESATTSTTGTTAARESDQGGSTVVSDCWFELGIPYSVDLTFYLLSDA